MLACLVDDVCERSQTNRKMQMLCSANIAVVLKHKGITLQIDISIMTAFSLMQIWVCKDLDYCSTLSSQ